MQYFTEKDFYKSLRKANLSGGPAQRCARKIKEILGGISLGDDNPFRNFSTTNNGETRLKNCIKYKLDDNYRLVTQVQGDVTLILFFGNHDETDKYLNKNKGHQFLFNEEMKRLETTFVSNLTEKRTVALEADDAEGYLWDEFEDPLDDLAGGLSLKQIRQLTALEKGVNADTILTLILGEQEHLSDQMLALYDVLNCVNTGDLIAAQNRYDIWKNKSFLVEEIPSDISEDINDSDTIKRIDPNNNSFEEELERYLNHEDPLEWFIFTHPDQENLISADFDGPAQISGVSGSGKTSVLIKRACKLLKENKEAKVLVITLNQSLALLIENILKALVTDDEYSNLEVLPYYDLCRNILRQFDPDTDKSYRQISSRLDEHFDEVFREFYRCETNNFDARCMLELHKSLLQRGYDAEKYVKEEFTWVRSFLTPSNYSEYQSIERKGRKLPLGQNFRDQILEGIDGWIKKMRSVGVADTAMITHKVFEFENSIKPLYDHTLVDEVQDLGTLELKLLRLITKPGKNDLFLVGDVAQSVLAKHLSFSDAKIDYRERNYKLELNYRNTKQILEAAYEVMLLNLDETLLDTEDLEFLDPKYANRSGEKPYLLSSSSIKEELMRSLSLARSISENSLNNQNRKVGIIVCGYTNLEIVNFAKANGLSSLQSDFDFRSSNIYVSDLEHSKGFEFDDVIILNCNNKVLPPIDVPDEEAFRMGCQFYVAMTRAKSRLFISYSGDCSNWITARAELFKKAHWDEFIEDSDLEEIDVPQKLPELINASDEGDRAILELTGAAFIYTRFAMGVEKRVLDWLERNVTGLAGFREGNKGVRNKWETLNQLYTDLKRNQSTKTVPYYFSLDGDREILELFEFIERAPIGKWKNKVADAKTNVRKLNYHNSSRKISAKRNNTKKRSDVLSKTQGDKGKKDPLKKVLLKNLNLSFGLQKFFKKANIQTVEQALELNAADYLKDPSLNRSSIEETKNILQKARDYQEEIIIQEKRKLELERRKKELEAEKNHPKNTLSENEKHAIWLIENCSLKFDEKSIERITKIGPIRQKKLRSLINKYPNTELGIKPDISDEMEQDEIQETLRNRERGRAKFKKLTETNEPTGKLPDYNPYEDK